MAGVYDSLIHKSTLLSDKVNQGSNPYEGQSFGDRWKDIQRKNLMSGSTAAMPGLAESIAHFESTYGLDASKFYDPKKMFKISMEDFTNPLNLREMNEFDRASFFDPLNLGGNSDYKRASEKIDAQGQQALDIGQQWKNELGENYSPWMGSGLQSLYAGLQTAPELLNQSLPSNMNSAQSMQGYMNNLQRFNNQQVIPEAMQVTKPTGPDYAAARESSLYGQLQDQSQRQIANSSALQGGSVRGGNAALQNAQAARSNLMNTADTLYQQDVNNYQRAMANNQNRNQLLTNQYSNNLGLQQKMNELKQNQYATNMDRYQSQQDNLMRYIDQMNKYGNMGLGSLSQYSNYGSQAIGSQLGTLSGLANAQANASAAKQQGTSNAIGAGAGFIGGLASMFSDPALKENMQPTGDHTREGFAVYHWYWKPEAFPIGQKLGLDLRGFDMGVNAREVQAKRPDLVTTIDGYLAVNYGGLL